MRWFRHSSSLSRGIIDGIDEFFRRRVWTSGAAYRVGIAFGVKQMLEVAVALLGASIPFRTLAYQEPSPPIIRFIPQR